MAAQFPWRPPGGERVFQASSDSVAAMAKQAVYKVHTFHVSGQENKKTYPSKHT